MNKKQLRGNIKAKGFTLIELLVVVLIIAILAAVALPQYQKAVEKSRAAQALTLFKSVQQAQQAYYVANGVYPSSLDELDIDIPWSGTKKWWEGNAAARSNGEWSLQLLSQKATGVNVLFIGRINGPYQGAGFGASNMEPLTCYERISNGTVFKKDAGDYCQKLWGGILSQEKTTATIRVYTLP